MIDFKIRMCSCEDIETIINLQRAWEKEDITFGFAPADKEWLCEKLGKYFLVAEQCQRIIGFVYGTIHEAKNLSVFENGEKYIELEDIYVDSEYRDSTVGSSLIDSILELAGKEGVHRSLIYSATKKLDRIMEFYRRHGYKTWYVQMFK